MTLQYELQNKCTNFIHEKKVSQFYYLCKIKYPLIENWIIQNELVINDFVNINSPAFRGYTPLHFAVKSKNIVAVKILLKNGANFTLKNAKGQTPLHLCMDMFVTKKKWRAELKYICRDIFDHEINYTNPVDEMGLSHFHIAIFNNVEYIIQSFMEHGIEINSSINFKSFYWSGYTPLHIACKYSLYNAARLLLNYGANINLKDAVGFTPLHYALKKGNKSLIRLLFSKLNTNDANLVDCEGISLLHAYCKIDASKQDLEDLLNSKVDINASVNSNSPLWAGYTPLHVALNEKHMGIVRILVKYGADVTIEDVNKISPLQLAIHKYLTDSYLMDLIFEYNKEVVMSIDNVRLFDFFSIFLKDKLILRSLLLNNELPVNRIVPLNYSLGLSGYTSLHFAVERGDVEIIELLLKRGANIYTQDNNGMSPLHLAIERRNNCIVEKCFCFCNEVLENPIDNNGLSHLHIACRANKTDVVNKYLQSGVEINLPTKTGETPLHFAVKFNSVETVKLLLENSADITAQEITNGLTPLHIAAEIQNDKIINMILSFHSNKIINPVNKKGLSHFHIACMNNRTNLVETFLRKGLTNDVAVKIDSVYYPGFTSLHFAVKYGYVGIVKILLKYGANINAKNGFKKVPFHYAFKLKQRVAKQILELFWPTIKKNGGILKDEIELSALHIACIRNDYFAVKDFLNQGSDINHRTGLNCPLWPGFTPLHFAAKYGSIETVELLLRNKANVHIIDKYGFTALHLAGFSSNEKIVEKLLASNSDPGAKNINGLTPIRLAKQRANNQIVHMLLSQSAKTGIINPMDNKGLTYLHITCMDGAVNIIKDFLTAGVDVDEPVHSFAKKFPGYTPLHIAVERRNVEIMELLLAHGANINAVSGNEGFTSLHLACRIHAVDILYTLLKHGADSNIKTACGNTLVSLAVRRNHADILEVALQHGADPNLANFDGCRPLHLAMTSEHEHMIDILLKNGADATLKSFDGKTFAHTLITTSSEVRDKPFYTRIFTRLLEHGCDLDARDDSGRSVLHLSYWPVNVPGLTALLNCGANVDVEDLSGRTIVSYFAEIVSSRVPWTELQKLFHRHLYLRKIAGFKLSRTNEELYQSLFEDNEESEDENGVDNDYFTERLDKELIREVYQNEIRKMKELRFGGFISLREMFINVNRMAFHLARNGGLSEFLKSDQLDEIFPECRCLIMMQYGKAIKRRDWVLPAQAAINRFVTRTFEIRWNDECSEALIEHLDEEDLRNVASIYDMPF